MEAQAKIMGKVRWRSRSRWSSTRGNGVTWFIRYWYWSKHIRYWFYWYAGNEFLGSRCSSLDPQTLQLYQELGLLPPSDQLMDQMDQQQPGILDQLSNELTEYFQNEIALKRSEEVEPAPVTRGEEQQQIQKYQQDQHQESLAEFVINRRGVFGPAINQTVRKNPLRGKYPRSSSGGFVDTQQIADAAARKDNPLKSGRPKKQYRPGKGSNGF